MKPLIAVRDAGRDTGEAAPLLPPADTAVSIERSLYAPPASSRIVGVAGTAAICAAVMAALLVTISTVVPSRPSSVLKVMSLLPEASPPETPPTEKEAPRPVQEKIAQPERPRQQPVERTVTPLSPLSVPLPAEPPKPANPGPTQPETAAPKTMPAPPAPQLSSNAADTWEGRVLAALNRERRYPRLAMARRQQGVPYVRFVMDRDGKVLSAQIERSSGFPDLDREAVSLPKRAQPLPKPPRDKPGITLELVVPVEFFLR